MESHKHQLADPHFLTEPADHKMLYQNLETHYEATGMCIDKCLMPGQAILPLFNLKIQCSSISLLSISGSYHRCPHTEREMKLYLLPYFLRSLSHLSPLWLGAQERTKCRVLEKEPETMVCTREKLLGEYLPTGQCQQRWLCGRPRESFRGDTQDLPESSNSPAPWILDDQ